MKKHAGFSLIEILVTLGIVSIGLLGIVALIANSLKGSQSAYMRTQASWLTNDIIEKMRANRITVQGAANPYTLTMGAATPSGNTIPERDLRDWRTALSNTLPGGTGSVLYNSLSQTVTVVTQWNDIDVSGTRQTGLGSIQIQTRL